MPIATAADRLQGDIETICEIAKDGIDAALWHWSRNPIGARGIAVHR